MNNYDDELIKQYITHSISIAEVLRKLNIDPRGRNYKIVKDVIVKFNIDTSHFLGKSHCKNKIGISNSWDDVLIKDSPFIITTSRKKRLIKERLLINECYNCKLQKWLGREISLQIDHINGINNDHRLENLRLLCPNCHSQTETFAGKNIKNKKVLPITNKCECGNEKLLRNKSCKECYNKNKFDKLTKIIWPNNEDLLNMIKQSNVYQVSKKLGVSFNALKKRLKARGLYGAFNL